MKDVYLNPEILQWPRNSTRGLEYTTYDYVYRAREIWLHAYDKLSENCSDLDRVDCVSALKRAVNHRLQTIYKVHKIDALPSKHGRKRTFEKLQEFGIVRPTILKELFEIRNAVEHQDIEPPDIHQCNRYVDIVWYFLKSTDELAHIWFGAVDYAPPDSDWTGEDIITVEMDLDNEWAKFKLTGTLNKTLICQNEKDGWIVITSVVFDSITEKNVKIIGTFSLSKEYLKVFAHNYFTLYGYFSHESE